MAEGKKIGSIFVEALVNTDKFKAGIHTIESKSKALADSLTKTYGGIKFPIDTPMKEMVEVMKEANRKAKLEAKYFGRIVDSMAHKMSQMTKGGIITPLIASGFRRQIIEISSSIGAKFATGWAMAKAMATKFATHVKNVFGRLKNFIFSWRTLVAGAIAAAFSAAIIKRAISGLKTLVSGVIGASSSYEQLRLTLKVLLKDQEKANVAFDEARELAKKTAFSVEEVVGSYAQLLAYGFKLKEVPDLLLLAADAATAYRKSIDEVIRGMSYLKAGRIEESMLSMGITREALGARGVEFDAGGALKSSTEEFFKAAMGIWEDSVKGMSVEGQKTWKGMISNLKDEWTDFQARIGAAGFFDAIKDKVKAILDLIATWAEEGKLKAWADYISQKMTDTLNGITAIIEKITGIDLSTKITGPTPDRMDWLTDETKLKEIKEKLKLSDADIADIKLAWSTASGEFSEAFTKDFLGSEAGLVLTTKAAKLSKYITDGINSTAEETKTALTPFWEKIISGIGGETFTEKAISALSVTLNNIANNAELMESATNIGLGIGGAIIGGIGRGIELGLESKVKEPMDKIFGWIDILGDKLYEIFPHYYGGEWHKGSKPSGPTYNDSGNYGGG